MTADWHATLAPMLFFRLFTYNIFYRHFSIAVVVIASMGFVEYIFYKLNLTRHVK